MAHANRQLLWFAGTCAYLNRDSATRLTEQVGVSLIAALVDRECIQREPRLASSFFHPSTQDAMRPIQVGTAFGADQMSIRFKEPSEAIFWGRPSRSATP